MASALHPPPPGLREQRTQVPIFPLGTVLFPDGVLPLRIFEARYMDMVRRCMRSGEPFGVCLITRGLEVGEPATHMPVGCLARIADWDMRQLGLLHVRTIGTQRFRLTDSTVQADGLRVGTVELLPHDHSLAIPPWLSPCRRLLEKVLAEVEANRTPDAAAAEAGETGPADDQPDFAPFERPWRLDEAGWVANRLAEILPLPRHERQALMEMDDALGRLAEVMAWLQARGVVSA